MTMTDDQMAASYYRAAVLRVRPEFVPATIRLTKELFGDGPFRGAGVAAGDHTCQCNQWGAVTVLDRSGKALGVKPAEFEVLTWCKNEVAV